MSDEDLLIKQTVAEAEEAAQAPQGRSGIQVPSDFVPISFFGVLKEQATNNKGEYEDQYIEQKFTVQVPRNTPSEDVVKYIWRTQVLPTGVLTTTGLAGEVNLYPLELFKRFTAKPSAVVGVTL